MKIGELDVLLHTRRIYCRGTEVKVSSRAFDILAFLIDADGAVVSTRELLTKVWPTTVVEENNIQVHISNLRRALGAYRHLIKTEAGRGYRLDLAQTPPISSLDCCPTRREGVQPSEGTSLPSLHGQSFGLHTVVERIVSALVDPGTRLVSVVGAPGVGKSRAAVEAAVRCQQQRNVVVTHVPLALTCATSAKEAIAARLSQSTVRATEDRSIVILDDCDHAQGAIADVLETVLRAGSPAGRTIMLTSRLPVHIGLETVVCVHPLPIFSPGDEAGPALQMFLARVRALNRRTVTDSRFIAKAVHVLELLDGLPFAIEIAARHTALLGIDAVESLMAQGLNLSMNGINRDCHERHRSLRAAFAWSKRSLSELHYSLLDAAVHADTPLSLDQLAKSVRLYEGNSRCVVAAVSDLIEASFLMKADPASPVAFRVPTMVRAFLVQQRASEGEMEVGEAMTPA